MAKTHGPSICAAEALTHFLLMGPGRTLPALEKLLAEHPNIPIAPAKDCLKRWSAKHKWMDEADRYDAGMVTKARERQLETEIAERFEWTREFSMAGKQILDRVKGEAERVKVNSVADLAHLAQIAVVCAREADAMLGAKPLEAPDTAAKPADNVTEGDFPAPPAPKTGNEEALAALEAMTAGNSPPN